MEKENGRDSNLEKSAGQEEIPADIEYPEDLKWECGGILMGRGPWRGWKMEQDHGY